MSSPDSQLWSVQTGGFKTPGDDMGYVVQCGTTVLYYRTVLVVEYCTVLQHSTLCTTLQYCALPVKDIDPAVYHVGTVKVNWTVLAYSTTQKYSSTVLCCAKVHQSSTVLKNMRVVH